MKKHILAAILCLSVTFTLFAKDKVINQPVFEFTRSGINHVDKIELGKDETRVYVHTMFVPHWWVKFPKEATFIEDSETGQRWFVTDIKNGEFDKEIYMPESGDSTFVLIFPKLDKKVKKIDLSCDDEDDKGRIYGISLNPKEKKKTKEVPSEVKQWINGELANAKRKTLMNTETGEFFYRDTARLVGYIKGYDPRAGFSTGMIYIGNEITREDYPIVVQVHKDGRFEASIPMSYPRNLSFSFNEEWVPFYIEPGQTLAVTLDWYDFLMADRLRNLWSYKFSDIHFQGAAADINKELHAFQSQLPELPVRSIYEEISKKEPDEYKAFLETVTADYTNQHKHLLNAENLSERARKILQTDYELLILQYLMEYESSYRRNRDETLPIDFYSFLQDVPMNDKELLSTPSFGTFINRFEYAAPFDAAGKKAYEQPSPQKTLFEYLFEELNLEKTQEDIDLIASSDSIFIWINNPEITGEKRTEIIEEHNKKWDNFFSRHGEDKKEAYQKKYIDVLDRKSAREIMTEQLRINDSIYTNELKLMPSITYEIMKVRSLDYIFGDWMEGQKEESAIFLAHIKKDIQEPFLKDEADRLFRKNYPIEGRTAYELPDTREANLFKELIAPYKGKILLVDFWGTTCGPCIAGIKAHKGMREKHKGSSDVDFVFISSPDNSPQLSAYNKFIEEHELENTHYLSADDFRYLRQLFKFNGIPRYIIVDREGRIWDDDASSYSFETTLEEMLQLEKSNQAE